MCKQPNGPVLKSLKTKLSGPKSEKKVAGQNFVFRFGVGPKFLFIFRTGLGPKFQFLFRADPVPNFFFLYFGPRLQPCGPCKPLVRERIASAFN